jgi:hypothetical protein
MAELTKKNQKLKPQTFFFLCRKNSKQKKKKRITSCNNKSAYRFWSHAGPKQPGRLPTKRRENKNQVKHLEEKHEHFLYL